MIVVQGWASFVGLLVAAVVGSQLEGVMDSRAVAYGIGGLAMAVFGLWINLFDENRHRIFWIPIQFWGLIITAGAMAGL